MVVCCFFFVCLFFFGAIYLCLKDERKIQSSQIQSRSSSKHHGISSPCIERFVRTIVQLCLLFCFVLFILLLLLLLSLFWMPL